MRDSTNEARERQRKMLASRIDQFLAAGGQITTCGNNASARDIPTGFSEMLTPKRANDPDVLRMQERRRRAKDMHEQGFSRKEIAEALGIPMKRMGRILPCI